LNDTNTSGAKVIAERIRTNIENHTISYGMEIIKLTASLGISTLRENDDCDSVIQRADNAMYYAKKSGRNQTQVELALSIA
jgi:diguanylate cyclase (GGDEF)-like protein